MRLWPQKKKCEVSRLADNIRHVHNWRVFWAKKDEATKFAENRVRKKKSIEWLKKGIGIWEHVIVIKVQNSIVVWFALSSPHSLISYPQVSKFLELFSLFFNK